MDKAENELLTRVGPGTRMGALLRRYWWPVWFTEQVTDKPVPVRLLGEDLVLFRDPAGKLGLVERYCAHRRVSLEFGRVEEGGIRCCYHGWKYGTDGSCVDLPLEPEGSGLKRDVKLAGYAVFEAGGLIFAYLGPRPVPAFPRWDILFRESGLTKVGADEEYCNWLQRAENTVDQHHLCSLHASVYPQLAFKRSEIDWDPAWFGLNITMRVPGISKPKLDQFIFPSSNRFTQARVGVPPSHNLRIRVPTDDTKTTTFWVKTYPSITDQGRLKTEGLQPCERGVYARAEDGWWDIPSSEQDRVAQESQGLITDRSTETLGWTDRGIVIFRKMLHDGLDAIDEGRDPLGVLREERNVIDLSASMDELASLTPAE
ncbi:MAG TPA: Rieske 2Fe-2S domain-containing protein [Stellaceae bacterium]|jgi:5,5'-dehydrodivanillate O-demethylase|nr:Rieske 2Fe-2S domain-containing protein [Stellaceae bacterium]